MSILYNKFCQIDSIFYLPCWILYMDLIETQGNPEDYDYYNWESIKDHSLSEQLHYYKRNMDQNMEEILLLVEECVLDITNNTEGYSISIINNDNKIDIIVDIDCGITKCVNCGELLNGYNKCHCYS